MTVQPPANDSRQRLLIRVARMYHEQGVRQPQIAEQLHISQAKVSRLLKSAEDAGIVKVTVHVPLGGYEDLEEGLVAKYGLADAVVTEAGSDDETAIIGAVGAAAAAYLTDVLLGHERIGISSWSSTLLAMVNHMPRAARKAADSVVQVIGGVGEPPAQILATRLTEELAARTGATPYFIPAPGFASSAEMREAILAEPYIKDISQSWSTLTYLLAGIGSLEPSPLLRDSGNAIPADAQERLRDLGAIGDVCIRFFNATGESVRSDIESRLVGIDAETLLTIPRRVGVAGGVRKHAAIRAALLGKWVNVLVTDNLTATALLTPTARPTGR